MTAAPTDRPEPVTIPTPYLVGETLTVLAMGQRGSDSRAAEVVALAPRGDGWRITLDLSPQWRRLRPGAAAARRRGRPAGP